MKACPTACKAGRETAGLKSLHTRITTCSDMPPHRALCTNTVDAVRAYGVPLVKGMSYGVVKKTPGQIGKRDMAFAALAFWKTGKNLKKEVLEKI